MNPIILTEEETKTIKYINNGKKNTSEYIYPQLEKMNTQKVPQKNFMNRYSPPKMLLQNHKNTTLTK